MSTAASFVWADCKEAPPNTFVFFRFRFELRTSHPTSATLRLFADTRYRLSVNGVIVGYGPASFHLNAPEADGYDLRSYLKQGTNELQVLVNHRGLSSYQAVPSNAGFWAEGSIETDEGALSLNTPGAWQAKTCNAWWNNAPTFSFAQASTEMLSIEAYESLLADESGWVTPVVLEQHHWGALSPRSVPPLSLREQLPLKLLACGKAKATEEQRSFHLQCIDIQRSTHGAKASSTRFPYATWIHSPKAQELGLGLFWGPHYLNGTELTPIKDPLFGNRENHKATLKAGWNLLYGEPEMLGISWGLQIAWPAEAGLTLSHSPQTVIGVTTEDDWCLTGQPIAAESLVGIHNGTIPHSEACLERFKDILKPLSKVAHSPFPTRYCAWQTLDAKASHIFPWEFPLTVPLNDKGDGIVLLDFNSEWIGHIQIEIEAPSGAILRVSNDELLRADGLLRFYLSSHLVNNTDMYVLAGKRQTVEGYHQRGGRYVQLNISSPNGAVVIHKVSLRRHLLDLPVEGSFSCPDPLLNWLWQAGVATQQASLHEAWVDPWREQGSYMGDTFVEALATRCYTAELRPLKRCLLNWLYGQHENGQMPCVTPSWYTSQHEDFTLIWVLMVRNYALQSKDIKTVEKLMVGVRRVLNSASWITDASGLWTAKGTRTFCDWGCEEEAIRCDANAILNAFRIGALDAAAEIATVLGNKEEARTLTEEGNRIRELYDKQLWLECEGCYAGGYMDGEITKPYGHGNSLALLFKIGSTERQDRLANWLIAFLNKQIAAEPNLTQRCGHIDLYFLHYTVEALGQHGAHAEILRIFRHIWGNHWKYDALTLWESYVRGLNGVGSQCHGWAAAPMVYFMRHVLGINIEQTAQGEPIVLRPNCPILPRAEGVFPLCDGPLRINYQTLPNEVLFTVSAPEGTRVTLELGNAWKGLPARIELSYH